MNSTKSSPLFIPFVLIAIIAFAAFSIVALTVEVVKTVCSFLDAWLFVDDHDHIAFSICLLFSVAVASVTYALT